MTTYNGKKSSDPTWKMRAMMVVGVICILLTPAAGAWETHEIVPLGDGEDVVGVTVDTHPVTGNIIVAYGIQHDLKNLTVFATISDDGMQTTRLDTVHEYFGSSFAIGSVMGMSHSKTGTAFCVPAILEGEVMSEGGEFDSYNGTDLFYTTDSSYGSWNKRRVPGFNIAVVESCDTGLPRNGWRAPPAVSFMGTQFLSTTQEVGPLNQTVWAQFGADGSVEIGPHTMLGDDQVSTDIYEARLLPGSEDGPPLQADARTSIIDTKCQGSGLQKLGCWGKKGLEGIVRNGLFWAEAPSNWFQKQQNTAFDKDRIVLFSEPMERSNTRTRPIADDVTVFTAGGRAVAPLLQSEVNMGLHSYANRGEIAIEHIASRPGTSELGPSAAAWVQESDAMLVYADDAVREARFRNFGMDGIFNSGVAFEYESQALWLRLKGTPGGEGGNNQFYGAIINSQGQLDFFSTDNNGRDWKVERITENATHNLLMHTEHHSRLDVARDDTRDLVMVAYADEEGVKLAMRHHERNFTPIRTIDFTIDDPDGPKPLDDGLISTMAKALKMNWEGTAYLLYVMFFTFTVTGIAVFTKRFSDKDQPNAPLAVYGGGILSTMAAIGFSLITYWIVVPITILFVAIKNIMGER